MNTTTAAEGFTLRGPVTPISRLLRSAWDKRALVRLLARRDFHVRYRRPTLGLLWVVIVPVVQAVVLSVVFSRIVRVQTQAPYPVFVLAGLLPWLFFSVSLTAATTSITGASGLATKVYFPRALLPIIAVRSNLYGFGLRVLVVIAAAVVFGAGIRAQILLLVPATVLMVALTAAFALVLAALQVYFRDVAFVMGAFVQAWFWASAVIYPVALAEGIPVVEQLLVLNPATGMVALFRWAIAFEPVGISYLVSSAAWSAVLFAVALGLYRRFDRVFVDQL